MWQDIINKYVKKIYNDSASSLIELFYQTIYFLKNLNYWPCALSYWTIRLNEEVNVKLNWEVQSFKF